MRNFFYIKLYYFWIFEKMKKMEKEENCGNMCARIFMFWEFEAKSRRKKKNYFMFVYNKSLFFIRNFFSLSCSVFLDFPFFFHVLSPISLRLDTRTRRTNPSTNIFFLLFYHYYSPGVSLIVLEDVFPMIFHETRRMSSAVFQPPQLSIVFSWVRCLCFTRFHFHKSTYLHGDQVFPTCSASKPSLA